MIKNIYCNLLGALIVIIILETIQGYPYEHSEELRSTDYEDYSPEVVTSNHDKAEPPVAGARDSLAPEPRMKTRATSVRMTNDSDGKIIFPPDLPLYISPQKKFPPSLVTTCKNTTFCENPLFYPEKFIKSVLTTRQDLKNLASVDTKAPQIGERIDVEDDYESLCGSEDKLVYPRTAENKDKEWLFVVNDDNFRQGVRIETCMTEKTACRIIEGFARGYETLCKQKFIYRQLAGVSTNGSVGPDLFRFPASCCCYIKFAGNPLIVRSRIGGGEKENLQTPVTRKPVSRAGAGTSRATEKKNENESTATEFE